MPPKKKKTVTKPPSVLRDDSDDESDEDTPASKRYKITPKKPNKPGHIPPPKPQRNNRSVLGEDLPDAPPKSPYVPRPRRVMDPPKKSKNNKSVLGDSDSGEETDVLEDSEEEPLPQLGKRTRNPPANIPESDSMMDDEQETAQSDPGDIFFTDTQNSEQQEHYEPPPEPQHPPPTQPPSSPEWRQRAPKRARQPETEQQQSRKETPTPSNPRLHERSSDDLKLDFLSMCSEIKALLPRFATELDFVLEFVSGLPQRSGVEAQSKTIISGFKTLKRLVSTSQTKTTEEDMIETYPVLIKSFTGEYEPKYFSFGFDLLPAKLRTLTSAAWNIKAKSILQKRLEIKAQYSYISKTLHILKESVDHWSRSKTTSLRLVDNLIRVITANKDKFITVETSSQGLPEDYKKLVAAEQEETKRLKLIENVVYNVIAKLQNAGSFFFSSPELLWDFPTGDIARNHAMYTTAYTAWLEYENINDRHRSTISYEDKVGIDISMSPGFYDYILYNTYSEAKKMFHTIDEIKSIIVFYKDAWSWFIKNRGHSGFRDVQEYAELSILPREPGLVDPADEQNRMLSIQEIEEYINDRQPRRVTRQWDYISPAEWHDPVEIPNDTDLIQKFGAYEHKVLQKITFPDFKLGMIMRPSVSADEVVEAEKLPYVDHHKKIVLTEENNETADRFVLVFSMARAHKSALMNLLKDNPDTVADERTIQYFITVNSNLDSSRLMSEANIQVGGFNYFCKNYFEVLLPGMIQPMSAYGSNFTMKNITDWRILFSSTEVSPQTGRIHWHALLQIKFVYLRESEDDEVPKFHVNYSYFRNLLLPRLPSVYVNLEPVTQGNMSPDDDNWLARIQAYINKGNKASLGVNMPHYTGIINPGSRAATRSLRGRRRN